MGAKIQLPASPPQEGCVSPGDMQLRSDSNSGSPAQALLTRHGYDPRPALTSILRDSGWCLSSSGVQRGEKLPPLSASYAVSRAQNIKIVTSHCRMGWRILSTKTHSTYATFKCQDHPTALVSRQPLCPCRFSIFLHSRGDMWPRRSLLPLLSSHPVPM